MKVAILASPWLRVPPDGYGGIEVIVHDLVHGLKKLGIDVELFSVKKTRIRGVKVHYLYDEEQFMHIHKPMHESMSILLGHLKFALNKIREIGDFDLIHDHNVTVLGSPLVLHYASQCKGFPPTLHTLHGPPFSSDQTISQGSPDNRIFFEQFTDKSKVFFVGISETLMKAAPRNLKKQILPPVHNAINVDDFIFKDKKQSHFITLARFNRDKGQHIAAKLCDEMGLKLKMAGTVSGISSPKQLHLEIANPLSGYRNAIDFRYFSDEILPIVVNNPKVSYVGNVQGRRKLNFIANARALLFPIYWDEPFGMSVIEALASGTPVVAMKRGAMAEIIEHGVNGFLADSVEEFREFMQKVDEIDPAVCRQTVIDKFSAPVMAENYLDRYKRILKLAG